MVCSGDNEDWRPCLTSNGLCVLTKWGSLRHTANMASVMMTTAKYVDEAKARQYR